MKLSVILRRGAPFLPIRAGIPPTWDRPDPPDTKISSTNKRLNLIDKHYSFFDGASPVYLVVNSQVAEGDLGEAFPNFLKNFAVLFLAGTFIGSLGFLWSNRPKIAFHTNLLREADKLEHERINSETKYGLKDLQNNPWKLNVWPESFPIRNLGIQDKAASLQSRSEAVQVARQINKEALAYWTRIYAEAEEAVKSGHRAHHH